MSRPARAHCVVLSAALWVLRTGAPWRDLPERSGPWSTAWRRFRRWTASRVWACVLTVLQHEADAAGEIDRATHLVDGAVVWAHQHAAGALGGQDYEGRDRSRGGFSTKVACARRGRSQADGARRLGRGALRVALRRGFVRARARRARGPRAAARPPRAARGRQRRQVPDRATAPGAAACARSCRARGGRTVAAAPRLPAGRCGRASAGCPTRAGTRARPSFDAAHGRSRPPQRRAPAPAVRAARHRAAAPAGLAPGPAPCSRSRATSSCPGRSRCSRLGRNPSLHFR